MLKKRIENEIKDLPEKFRKEIKIKDKIKVIQQSHRLGSLDMRESLRNIKEDMIHYLKKNLPLTEFDRTEIIKTANSIK